MNLLISKSIRLITLILIVSSLLGCTNKLTPKKDVNLEEPKGIYDSQISDLYNKINGFKYDAFLMCLRKGYNNSDVADSIMDLEFKPTEWQGYTYANKLKDVVQITEKKIRQDSIFLSATWLQDPNYYNSGNKRVIAHCLELYASKELEIARQEIDSITKMEWKQYKETLKSMHGK
jgi:hypothetical protein